MRAEEMRALSDDQVTSRIAELERERFNLRFKAGTQPLEDPLRLRAVRKDLARLKTLVRERALGVVREAPAATASKSGAKKSAAKKAATKSATKKTATKRTAAKSASTSATTKQAPARGRRSGR